MKLLVPVFLLLALGFLATAEVVQSFNGCAKFFVRNTPPTAPTGGQYKMICQRKSGRYQFATLYDTVSRIPVYSAYKFQIYGKCKRKTSWYIEPQLDDPNGGPLMDYSTTVASNLRGQNQALNKDYMGSGYDIGHLVPVRHRKSQPCSDATFTLTNAAPQHLKFNRGKWNREEGRVAKLLTTSCVKRGFRAFIVTGVEPGNTNMNNRVNIPDYFWSAYCCVDNNNKRKLSGAFWGRNDQTNQVNRITITNLNNMLCFSVFPTNVCP